MIEVMVVSLKAPQGKPTQLSAHMLHNKFENKSYERFYLNISFSEKASIPSLFLTRDIGLGKTTTSSTP
jgi:hypothetical protein